MSYGIYFLLVVFCIFDINNIQKVRREEKRAHTTGTWTLARRENGTIKINFLLILAFDFCFGRKTFCWHRIAYKRAYRMERQFFLSIAAHHCKNVIKRAERGKINLLSCLFPFTPIECVCWWNVASTAHITHIIPHQYVLSFIIFYWKASEGIIEAFYAACQ